MGKWDERFRKGDYPTDPDPAPVLRRYVDTFPDGRALDIATGTGRNAVFLAENGYRVDALDKSREGLQIARSNAKDRGVDENCTWIQADAFEYSFPAETYDVVTIRSFDVMDRLSDVKATLAQGGVLYYQPQIRTTDPIDYGPDDCHRVSSNQLLRSCLDLTVLHYREFITGKEGHRGAYAQIVARKSTGQKQSLPHLSESEL